MKLNQRRKYVLYKLAFTHEVQWKTRPVWIKRFGKIDRIYPTLDGQDISCVMKSLRKDGLVRCYPFTKDRPLHITLKGIAALLESVT